VRIALPVLDERAEVVYHSEQRRMKRVVAAAGNVKRSEEIGVGRRDVRVDNEESADDQYLDSSFLRWDKFAGLIEELE
jgi:hypothetical protein